MRSSALLSVLLSQAFLSSCAIIIRQNTWPSPTVQAPTVTDDDGHEHGLGLFDPSPTSDNKYDKIDRSKWFKSYQVPPVTRPGAELNLPDETHSKGHLPKKVDWRNRYGVNWITSVQNQGQCGSCWAFSTTALIESMIRIQHGTWSKRSEADIFESSETTCNTGWFPGWALELIKSNNWGLTDEKCNVYYDADRPFMGCGDRQGRTLRIGNYSTIETLSDTKWWLANIGPVACSLAVYSDFQDWTPDQGVYHVSPTATKEGGHALLIVGYDDDQQAYIIKNSWGTDLGDNGYWLVGYGEAGIDDAKNPKYGVTNISPDQFARRSHHNGNIYQSAGGKTHRDFQAVRRTEDGNLLQVKRKGEEKRRWSMEDSITVFDFPDDAPFSNTYNMSSGSASGQPVLLETSFGRQKEMVYWVEEQSTFAHWTYTNNYDDIRDVTLADQMDGDVWLQTAPGGFLQLGYSPAQQPFGIGNVTGYPGFVQLDNSDFSIVVRTNDGSLTEYYRDSDIGVWNSILPRIAESGILQSGPALVQSNIGLNIYDESDSSIGNVYVVAVLETSQLALYWRTATGTWQAGEVFGEGFANTTPVMVQDFWNTADESAPGGFQLLVAADDGWVEHWQRINEDIVDNPPIAGEEGKWEMVGWFGDGEIAYVWGLVQGSFNFALEAIVEDWQGDLWHWEYTGVWEKKRKLPPG